MRKNSKAQQQAPKKKRKPIFFVECLPVYENRSIYFNNYLQEQIGAKWQQVKSSLYDAGYNSAEVNAYRDGLLADFNDLCREYRLRGII